MEVKTLRAKMLMHDVSVSQLCTAIGISKPTFYRKINGASQFTQGEISTIADMLSLSKEELCAIFFDNKVA